MRIIANGTAVTDTRVRDSFTSVKQPPFHLIAKFLTKAKEASSHLLKGFKRTSISNFVKTVRADEHAMMMI